MFRAIETKWAKARTRTKLIGLASGPGPAKKCNLYLRPKKLVTGTGTGPGPSLKTFSSYQTGGNNYILNM